MRSPRAVPPGSRVRIAGMPTARNAPTRRSAIVDLPEPSMPSSAMNNALNQLAYVVAGDLHSPMRLTPETPGGKRIALRELVLNLADSGQLR